MKRFREMSALRVKTVRFMPGEHELTRQG